ncbi:unnamed protein product [Litomosoides sigmodontis]|uniref:Uncharacterized protein n=1 Tax=Litomosoides sigmodontis TaxID=42156 RepID=A0A3P6UJ30_LITSI|nr:unnamed protein product [Litomosoides sigmodontis]
MKGFFFINKSYRMEYNAIRQQQGLPDDNRTFIISEPQRRSVFATLSSFNKSKKLFLNKGKVTEESTTSHPTTTTTTATTATTTTATNQGDLNASRGISTFAPTKMNENTLMVNLQAKPTTISSIGSGQLHDPIHLNNSSSILSQKRSKTLPRTDGAASNDKPEIVVNVPRSHSPHSTSNSSVSRGYPDDSSSVNNLHGAVEYKGGVNRRQNNNINEFRESLSSRLSRGFFEFTQGSSDRLQKWKNKLQNGRRHKDSSEPPTMNRKMLTAGQQQNGHLSNVEVALNWTMPQKCDSIDQIHNGKFPSTESASTPKGSQLNVALPVRSASDFFPISEHTVRVCINKTLRWVIERIIS